MSGKKILIVEDESIIALNLETILQNKGYDIVGTASSGEAALKIARSSNPDLVIADIILKGPMDGIALVEKLKEELNIPVIYITAHSDENTLDRAKKTKPSGYIIKPINTEQLTTTIEIAFYKHEMESKLTASENRYRSLAEAAQDAIFIIDKNDNIEYVNTYASRLFGYEPEFVIGKKRSDFFPHDVSDKQSRFIKKVFQSGNTIKDESIIFLPGGEKIWLSTILVPLKDNNGNITSVLGISRDISNIKSAEEKIRYQATVLQSVSEAIISTDMNFHILSWNEAAEKMYGWTSREVLGKSLEDILKPEYQKHDHKFVKKYLLENDRFAGEVIHYHKNGAPINALTSFSMIKNNDNIAVGIVAANRDITKLKDIEKELIIKNEELEAANEELKASIEELESTNEELIETQHELIESEEKYRALFNNANDAIFIHDMQGNMLEVNDIACARLGYSRDELMLMTPGDIDSPEFSPLVEKRIEELLREGSIIFESEHVSKDGTAIPVEISSRIIEFNHKPAVLSVARDRTEKKKAERELKVSYTNLKALIENMNDYAMICDNKGRPVMYNSGFAKAMKKTFNVDIEPGIKPAKFLKDKNLIKFWENNIRRVLKGEQFSVEYSHSSEDGEKFFEVSFTPIIEDGKVSGFTEIVRDITERKKTQEIIIQTEKMITVGSLAAGIAHEINNPLGVILQGIQLIRSRLSPEKKSNRAAAKKFGIDIDKTTEFLKERRIFEYLEGMHSSGKRAADIVANMLQFTRKSKSRLKPEHINRIIDKSIEIASKDYDFKKDYDFRRIKIVKNFANNLPEIRCSGSDMQQVFLNIFKNSAQAMSEISENKFQPVLKIKTTEEKGSVRIEISDNGPGMDSKTLKHIFEPFYTTKGIGFGTGLGLSISYYIVTNNHGGSISAESEPGKGTKFIIKLPV